MQTMRFPEIGASDLKAARDFLNETREEGRNVRATPRPTEAKGFVPVRHGIARARRRSAGGEA